MIIICKNILYSPFENITIIFNICILRCCNTCDEVRAAYREQQWAFPVNPENITQCKDERIDEKLKEAFKQGCQIYGTIVVNRVSGSFHIAPGKSFSINHVHVHDVQPFSSTEFNTTHKIRHLTFGERIMSDTHDPLKDTLGLAEEGNSKIDFVSLFNVLEKKYPYTYFTFKLLRKKFYL